MLSSNKDRAAVCWRGRHKEAIKIPGPLRAGPYNDCMSLLHITILAIIQGLAELLPISSSAHVVVAEKLLGKK